MDICDDVVEIPVYGLKNSLNVCSAATVAVYEVKENILRSSEYKEIIIGWIGMSNTYCNGGRLAHYSMIWGHSAKFEI